MNQGTESRKKNQPYIRILAIVLFPFCPAAETAFMRINYAVQIVAIITSVSISPEIYAVLAPDNQHRVHCWLCHYVLVMHYAMADKFAKRISVN